MNVPTWAAVASSIFGWTFAGYQLRSVVESLLRLRRSRKGTKRSEVIIARVLAQGGWIDLADFCELVTIWPGYASLACQVRRPWDPTYWPPRSRRDEGRAN